MNRMPNHKQNPAEPRVSNLIHSFEKIDKRLFELVGVEKLLAFIKTNGYLLTFLFVTGVIAYGYDLFSFTMKIDSENHAFVYGPQGAWVAQGRWGMYLLNALLIPDSVMPFIPTLIAISGCAIGALFFVLSLSNKRSAADYLAGPIAIACPLLYFAMYFTTLGYGVGVAFAVSCIGVYWLKHLTWLSAAMAVACFTLGIGIYQAVLPLIATLFCLQMAGAIIEEAHLSFAAIFRKVAVFIVILACAAALNQGIAVLMMQHLQVKFDTAYIAGFIHYELTADYFFNTLNKTLNTGWDYYTGGKNYYLFDLQSLKVLFLLTLLVALVRILTSPCHWPIKILGWLFLICAIAAPVMMLMLNGGYMPPRTVLGVPYVIAGLVFFAASSRSHVVRIIVGTLAIMCIYNFSMINNRYAFSNQMTWYADREKSVQILERIHRVLNKLPVKTDPYAQLPIEVVGWHEYFETPIFVHRDVIGASFYTWGAGDAERITRLFTTMGITDYRPATKQEKLSVIEAAMQMPFWPYEGSVDVVNGIIVVKLREYNPNQLMWMCAAPDDQHPSCLQFLPKQ